MNNDEQKNDMELIQKHVDALSEHFDTVQVFVTSKQEGLEGNTINANIGSGNWFARYGQVRTWLLKADERSKLEVKEEED